MSLPGPAAGGAAGWALTAGAAFTVGVVGAAEAVFCFFAAGAGRGGGRPTCAHVGAPGVGGSSSIVTSFTCTRAMPPL
jgi:hypothetical protein